MARIVNSPFPLEHLYGIGTSSEPHRVAIGSPRFHGISLLLCLLGTYTHGDGLALSLPRGAARVRTLCSRDSPLLLYKYIMLIDSICGTHGPRGISNSATRRAALEGKGPDRARVILDKALQPLEYQRRAAKWRMKF